MPVHFDQIEVGNLGLAAHGFSGHRPDRLVGRWRLLFALRRGFGSGNASAGHEEGASRSVAGKVRRKGTAGRNSRKEQQEGTAGKVSRGLLQAGPPKSSTNAFDPGVW